MSQSFFKKPAHKCIKHPHVLYKKCTEYVGVLYIETRNLLKVRCFLFRVKIRIFIRSSSSERCEIDQKKVKFFI
jgi:hypothetical protein